MVTIIQIFYLLIGIYSIVGGIIILFSYMDQRTESKKQFKKTNRKYLRKLVIYTLIVVVPIFFWEDALRYFGSYKKINSEYIYGMLIVPIFLWANALIAIISIIFDKENNDSKN